MIHVRCPHCGVWLDLAENTESEVLRCGNCGRSFAPESLSAAATVIDVHAEPVGGEEVGGDTVGAGETSLEQFAPESFEPSRPRVRQFEARQIYVNDNPGCCCGAGCLGMLLILWLILNGLAALF